MKMLYIIKKILPLLVVLPSLFLLTPLSGCDTDSPAPLPPPWFFDSPEIVYDPIECDGLRFEFEQGKSSEIINDTIKTHCPSLPEDIIFCDLWDDIDGVYTTHEESAPNESGETINYFRLSSRYNAPIGDHSGEIMFQDCNFNGGAYKTSVVVTLTEPTALILGEVSITPRLIKYYIPYPKYTEQLPIYVTGKTNLPMDSLLVQTENCIDAPACTENEYFGPGNVLQLTIPTTQQGSDSRTNPDHPFTPYTLQMRGSPFMNPAGQIYKLKTTAFGLDRTAPSNSMDTLLEVFKEDVASFAYFYINCGISIQPDDGSLHIQFKAFPLIKEIPYIENITFYLYQFDDQLGYVPNEPEDVQRGSGSSGTAFFNGLFDMTTNSFANKFLMIMTAQIYDDGPANWDRTLIQDVQRNMTFHGSDCRYLNVAPW